MPKEAELRERAAEAVRAVLDTDAAEAVINDEAFGAVVGRLRKATEDGSDPADVLAGIEDDDLAFVADADSPAAFLASRIPY